MTSLVRDVLNYSRLIKTDDSFLETDLQEIFSQVTVDLELIIQEKQAIVSQLRLPCISAVSQQIRQLFHNLLSNALKFHKGQPHISIESRTVPATELKEYPELNERGKYIELIFNMTVLALKKNTPARYLQFSRGCIPAMSTPAQASDWHSVKKLLITIMA